jgi:serine protease Do
MPVIIVPDNRSGSNGKAALIRPLRAVVRYRRTGFLAGCGLLLSLLSAPVASAVSKPVAPPVEALPPVFRESTPGSMADLKTIERQVEEVVHKVSPAVVAVRVGNSGGSAVVISSDGLVLCAAHVCGAPHRPVQFTFPDGRTAQGKTLGTDHGMDSGLMQITDPGPWPYVNIGSAQDPRLGEWVLALGHPGGFDPERPMVVRLGRVIRSADLVQTDCTLLGGDSGGPLFDMHGGVIGIHSRISDSTTENFHVPIRTFLDTWDRLANSENWGDESPPTWSTIGVRGVDDPKGCRLQQVIENGPAFKAGLLPGDVVLRVEGETISDADCLVHRVRQSNPGDNISVVIQRGDSELTLNVKVEARGAFGGRRRRGP